MPYHQGFQAIEAMQAASEAAGWECEFRQIDAGKLEARAVLQPVGDCSLLCETANRQLDVSAKTPEDAVTCIVALPGTLALINGRRLTDDRIMLLSPDIDIHAVSFSGFELWLIHLPTELLDERLDPASLGTRVIEGQSGFYVELRTAIQSALAAEQEHVLAQHEARFADLTQKLMSDDMPETRFDHYHRRQKRKALYRAVEYIEAHLTRPLRMGQICSYAGVSQSTLERVFRREFQQTPSAYLRARRLDVVRRKLQGELNASQTIADVALKHGFTHMGRFSSAYRTQFGLLPSEDVRYLQD